MTSPAPNRMPFVVSLAVSFISPACHTMPFTLVSKRPRISMNLA
jgi:hypothetical protein